MKQPKIPKKMKDDLLEKVKKIASKIPQSPGVYQMIDKNNNVIYVGKAKNLKNRVIQYFQQSKNKNIKTEKMVSQIHDVKYVETSSELEALLLETNFIKEIQPKYNILMRDDKNYVYIKVTTNEDFPKVYTVRRVLNDGAKYFGPKSSSANVQKTLDILRKIFKYCTCNLQMAETNNKLEVKGKGSIPCLDYHIKRCLGPCVGAVNKEEYNNMISELVSFLGGKYQDTLTKLTYRMLNLAEQKKFEAAGNLRDQINAIKDIFMPQLISEPNLISRDVIGLQIEFDQTYVNLFQFREGKLIAQDNFQMITPDSDEKNPAESFIQFHYSIATDIPQEILIRNEIENKTDIEKWLTEKSGRSTKILSPLKGKKNKILELSEKNAASFARQSKVKWISDTEKTTGACKELSEALGLNKVLERIECYDISHLAGVETVGSMVVFEKGSPKNADYRRFKIKQLETFKVDDFKSLEEVLTRRLSKLNAINEEEDAQIRKASKKDMESIQKVIKNEKMDDDNIENDDFTCAKNSKGKVTAFVRIKNVATTPEIANLWVEKKERGKKLGYKIMNSAIKKSKLQKVYLTCDKSLAEYYEKFGFKELKTVSPDLKKDNKYCGLHCKNPAYFVYQKKKTEIDTSFQKVPNLIIIDGGKGQLTAGINAMRKTHTENLSISLCSLAKKHEEIFLPDKSTSIVLPRNSQSLYLIQRIRDEAHRFAHEFNRSSHAKTIVKSQLDQIAGVGTIIKRKLLKTFGSLDGIRNAPMDDLVKCCGEYLANKIKESL